MRLRPARILLPSLFANHANGGFNLIWIGITLFDQAHWQPVRTKNQMNAGTVLKLPQDGADALRERLNIEWVVVKLADGSLRRPAFGLPVDAPPLLEAA